jgi:replication fork clamp-binding protein CrfC
MEYIDNIRSIIAGSSYKLTNLTDTKILEIGKSINSISSDIKLDDSMLIPSLVVVGSQSSGKSSVLNGILSMDILPTGKSMVTRTPLNLDLIQTETDMFAEFGKYQNSNWIKTKKIKLTNPLPTPLEIEQIHKEIESQTIQKAGSEMNISEEEINLKIYSPFVPNLNLIDLPGLTMVACTDKGQPKDIKIKIRTLIQKYIQQPKNIMLCVMPAREDLEADVALDLCKDFDKEGLRTIGVLTKIDLMNQGNNVVNYLEGNVSRDLILKYGYFAIKNRNKEDMLTKTIHEGISDESNYFRNNQNYKSRDIQDKLGIVNLSKTLSIILLDNIKKSIPNLISEIKTLQMKNEKLISNLGDHVPTDESSKASIMNQIINYINQQFTNNIEKRGSEINCGRRLKDIFINYRLSLQELKPFENIENKYLNDIISNSEGNHMTFSTPTIEVLESCLKDKNLKIFETILPLSIQCVKEIMNELKELLDKLLEIDSIKRFPKLITLLRETIIVDILNKNELETIHKINEIIEIEKNYIWTDDPNFVDTLKTNQHKFSNNNSNNTQILRDLCQEYFNSINYVIQHSIPKSIMLFLVKTTQNKIQSLLFNKTNDKKYLDFLVEDPEQNQKRIKYNSYKEKLSLSLKVLQSL